MLIFESNGINRLVMVLSFATVLGACSDGSVFEDGNNEKKGPSNGPSDNNAFVSPDTLITNFHGFYNFYVRRKDSDNIVCQGDAEIISTSEGTITKGVAPCTDRILRAAGVTEIEFNDEGKGVIEMPIEETRKQGLDPRVVRVTKAGETTYEPYTLDFVGPVIQESTAYSDINESTEMKVRLLPFHFRLDGRLSALAVSDLKKLCSTYP